jgi:N-acetylglucosamine-6-phosphate deacetylase
MSISVQANPANARLRAIVAQRLFDGEQMRGEAAVLIRGDSVIDVVARNAMPADCAVQDLAPGQTLAPGFIDIQVNGGNGVLLNDQPTLDGIAAIVAAHRRFGTTSCLPTLITDRRETLMRLAAVAEQALAIPGVLGFHLEGPFINPARKGVHPPQFIVQPSQADLALFARFGAIGTSLITLAPECVPADAIASLVRAGLRVAIGHSDATHAQVARAAEEGLTGATHLFNAMSQMTARQPGAVGTILDDRRIYAGIICDGYHVDPAAVRVALRAKGRERLMLVTDAMPTAGWEGASFNLCGQVVSRVGDRLVTADGTLAGAHLDMMTAVRRAVTAMGIALDDALIMASRTPAAFLGLDRRLGRIRAGYRADLTAFDESLTVTATWVAGIGTNDAA